MELARQAMLVALLAAFVPLAAAQVVQQQPRLTLEVEDAILYVEPGQHVSFNLTATYVAAPADPSAVDGVLVTFEVVEAPGWIVLTPEPADARMTHAAGSGPNQQSSVAFQLVGQVSQSDISGSREGEVLVRARAEATRLQGPAEAEMPLLLRPYGNVTAGERVNVTNAPPIAGNLTEAQEFWMEGAETPLVTQSRHEDDLSGGDGLFMALAASLGGYGGYRLKRRFS